VILNKIYNGIVGKIISPFTDQLYETS